MRFAAGCGAGAGVELIGYPPALQTLFAFYPFSCCEQASLQKSAVRRSVMADRNEKIKKVLFFDLASIHAHLTRRHIPDALLNLTKLDVRKVTLSRDNPDDIPGWVVCIFFAEFGDSHTPVTGRVWSAHESLYVVAVRTLHNNMVIPAAGCRCNAYLLFRLNNASRRRLDDVNQRQVLGSMVPSIHS
jgi:hypothetical protein